MDQIGSLRPLPGHPRDDAIEAAWREFLPFVATWRSQHRVDVSAFVHVLARITGDTLAPDTPEETRRIEDAGRLLVHEMNAWKTRHALTTAEFLFILASTAGRAVQSACLAERELITTEGKKT